MDMVTALVPHIDMSSSISLGNNEFDIVLEKMICSRYLEQKLSDLAFPNDIVLLDNSKKMF